MTMTRIEIPAYEHGRLRDRTPRMDDLDTYHAFCASDRSTGVGGPYEIDEKSWILFAAEIGHWHRRGFDMWTVTLQGTPIGLVGCWSQDEWPEQKIGWVMCEGYESKGYALEAAKAACAQCYGPCQRTTDVSYIHRDNARSIAPAERLGCTRDANATHPTPDALVFRHPSPADLAQQEIAA